MKMQLVGVQRQDYKLDSGYEFKGNKLHCVDLDSKPDGLQGCLVTTFKIADGSELAQIPLRVGANYTVFFDQKGNPAYFVEVKS